MAKRSGKKNKPIFTESIHGVSVGVQEEDKDKIKVKISDYKLPRTGRTPISIIREIANIDLIDTGKGKDVRVILRVYILPKEIKKSLKIFAYKKNKWIELGGKKNIVKHGKWAGYLQVNMKVGDPPIAVG